MLVPSDKIIFSDIVYDLIQYKFDATNHEIDNLIKIERFIFNFTHLFFDDEEIEDLDFSVGVEETEEGENIVIKLNNDYTLELFSTTLYEEYEVDNDDEDEEDNQGFMKINLN